MSFLIRLGISLIVGVAVAVGIYINFVREGTGVQLNTAFVTYQDASVRVQVRGKVQTIVRSDCPFSVSSIDSEDPPFAVEPKWDEFSKKYQIYEPLPAATWKVKLSGECTQAEWKFAEPVPYLFIDKGITPFWVLMLVHVTAISLGLMITFILMMIFRQ